MNWWKKPFFAACALALVLAVCSSSSILADGPVQYGADNLPPDPSTLQPMPPESPREQALSAMKEKSVAKVAELTRLRGQNRISDEEWRAGILSIREEVDAFKREAGWAVAPSTTNELNSESLGVTASPDSKSLTGMHFYNQTDQCANGCGVASSKEVLDYEHSAYGSPSYTFDQVRQDLMLTCCPAPGTQCAGVCLANYDPSIERTLEDLGPFSWWAVQPGTQSTWFDRVVTSIYLFGEPQVQLTRPNWDGPGGVCLPGWATQSQNAHHYIVVSGYNRIDNNVWYQDSAWWTAGDKWWHAQQVWSVNDHANASAGCAAPNKLIY